ncbi:hypothetical protein GLOTRDRAFT_134513 [Gloeophyllum trabeum ATCC 11539]|uniref:Uncharacterized protein n=1 Tax=Gloeophyllum trabeum (strain ATCC 11539 / FP-39264 / Madison 617) TaxID=670483 RepID=S7PQX5_GLOTA|nr:uncharacterized protein GLOTRDRAFT_134513 [Gloeophyllum trabeum ATCC 11539]EPQ49873.1 hypothetical protein GLOTRDRAFT_134513 [Gloeophyllum trabeum ATCC 11539]
MNDREFREFMCMTALDEQSKAGQYILVAKEGAIPWNTTKCAEAGIDCPLASELDTVLRCQDLTLANGDRIAPSKYVAYGEKDLPKVGQVQEILVHPTHKSLIGMLVVPCVLESEIEPYRFPRCRRVANAQCLLSFEDILCAVSTIHNCAEHGCVSTMTRNVIQERQITINRESEYLHSVEPEDRLLNLAQLRSSSIIQSLHHVLPEPEHQTCQEMIKAAVQNRKEWDLTQSKAKGNTSAKKRKQPNAPSAPNPHQATRARTNGQLCSSHIEETTSTAVSVPGAIPSADVRDTSQCANNA